MPLPQTRRCRTRDGHLLRWKLGLVPASRSQRQSQHTDGAVACVLGTVFGHVAKFDVRRGNGSNDKRSSKSQFDNKKNLANLLGPHSTPVPLLIPRGHSSRCVGLCTWAQQHRSKLEVALTSLSVAISSCSSLVLQLVVVNRRTKDARWSAIIRYTK